MRTYSVTQLAAFAGITPRTLHHYDEIGLLSPRARNGSGSRLYGVEELRRLQQILLYRERGLALKEIAERLESPQYDPEAALHEHREWLVQEIERLQLMLATVERTMSGEGMLGREYFAGFASETSLPPVTKRQGNEGGYMNLASQRGNS